MSLPVHYSRLDGLAVEDNFVHAALPNIQHILEKFEEEFKVANGYIDAYIKDDIGNISLVIECDNPDLKERMYRAVEPYFHR